MKLCIWFFQIDAHHSVLLKIRIKIDLKFFYKVSIPEIFVLQISTTHYTSLNMYFLFKISEIYFKTMKHLTRYISLRSKRRWNRQIQLMDQIEMIPENASHPDETWKWAAIDFLVTSSYRRTGSAGGNNILITWNDTMNVQITRSSV